MNKRIYLIFSLFFIILVIPVVLARFFYSHPLLLSVNKLNYGILLSPPFYANTLTKIATTKGWKLIYLPQACNTEKTQKMVSILEKLRQALAADAKRLKLFLIVGENCKIAEFRNWQKIAWTKEQYHYLARELAKNEGHQASLSQLEFFIKDKIYLMDPSGLLFMTYSSSVDVIDIFKDLQRVLKVSQVG